MSISGYYKTEYKSHRDYECFGCGGPILRGEDYVRAGYYGYPKAPYHNSCTLGKTQPCECSKCRDSSVLEGRVKGTCHERTILG